MQNSVFVLHGLSTGTVWIICGPHADYPRLSAQGRQLIPVVPADNPRGGCGLSTSTTHAETVDLCVKVDPDANQC